MVDLRPRSLWEWSMTDAQWWEELAVAWNAWHSGKKAATEAAANRGEFLRRMKLRDG